MERGDQRTCKLLRQVSSGHQRKNEHNIRRYVLEKSAIARRC